jgi:diadenosine tetraphosphate (Ap4A) HIT family hydrolase
MTFQLHPQLAKDCFVIGDLELCRLLLMNDRNYPWCILVPMREEKKDIYELTESEQAQLLKESSQLSHVMMDLFRGKKMNVAALGNMVPQLHIHHIVRRESDACWPKPVWGQVLPVFYAEAEALRIIEAIKQRL